jgi:transcriptional regulator GlxA family with amidase domain
MTNKKRVGIFLFNEVEVLDFAGPFEVFSLASQEGIKLFETTTIGEEGNMITARNGLNVTPNYSFSTAPKLDILIVPGGYGAEHIELKNKSVLRWIKNQYQDIEILASVCTGAFILAEAGILDNLRATTHWMDLNRLEKEYPKINAVRNKKYIDEGKILTSGGISAGINMAFHIIRRLYGQSAVSETAKRMEYDLIEKM